MIKTFLVTNLILMENILCIRIEKLKDFEEYANSFFNNWDELYKNSSQPFN